MRIGFDLDGVLMTQDICKLQIMRCIEDKSNLEWAREWYYREGRPLLDPNTVMANCDVGYVITCRDPKLIEVTRIWCKKYVPHLKLIHLLPKFKTGGSTFRDWCRSTADMKAEHINRLKLDLYFEDVPPIVKRLRKLCPNTKIIKYGTDRYEGLR